MASLTVRQLDESIKAGLRLRAAQSGRSVEDEVRVILREATDQWQAMRRSEPAAPNNLPTPSHQSRSTGTSLPRVTLIIGGGIAA